MKLVTELLLLTTGALAVVAPLHRRDVSSLQLFDGNINVTNVEAWASDGGDSTFQFVMNFIHFDPATSAGCANHNDTAQPSRITDAPWTFCNVAAWPENNPLSAATFNMTRTFDNGAFLNMTYIWKVESPWVNWLTYKASRYMPPEWFRYHPDRRREVYEGPSWFLTDAWSLE